MTPAELVEAASPARWPARAVDGVVPQLGERRRRGLRRWRKQGEPLNKFKDSTCREIAAESSRCHAPPQKLVTLKPAWSQREQLDIGVVSASKGNVAVHRILEKSENA